MKGWLFCVICFVFGFCTLLLLQFLEQRFHFKQWLINHLRIGKYLLIVYLAFLLWVGVLFILSEVWITLPFFLVYLWAFFAF